MNCMLKRDGRIPKTSGWRRQIHLSWLFFLGVALLNIPHRSDANDTNEWYRASLETQDERLEWFKEAKFGALVVWGLYSPLSGEWGGQVSSAYSEHIMRSHRIPLATYINEVAALFAPDQFDAAAWVTLCKQAGMKYVVPIGKFHDGIAMWPSELDALSLADTASPFQRDYLGEIRDECRRQDLRFGLYYSHAQDWAHPGGQRNEWDFPGVPTRPQWWQDPELKARHWAASERYVKEKSIPQMLEMVARYEPDLIWFDTGFWLPPEQIKMILKALREVAPDVVVSGRVGLGMGDYATTADQPDDLQPFHKTYDAWEAIPTTNLSYGYHAKDRSHKSVAFFIELLAKTVERGGNMLMNIGPMGNGQIDPADVKILEGIGDWMQVNGDSIYGTTHSPLPTQTFGHVSRNGNKLYLHVTNWPVDGVITLAGLKTPISKARLLASDQGLAVTRAGLNDWNLQGPEVAPDRVNTVIVVETDGEPVGNQDDSGILLVGNITEQRLHAFESKVEGGLKWGDGSPRSNGIINWNRDAMAEGQVTWTVRTEEPHEFSIDIVYVAVEGIHGGRFSLRIGDKAFTADVKTQPRPNNLKKVQYLPSTLGSVRLEPGIHRIVIKGEQLSGRELFMPSSVILRANR